MPWKLASWALAVAGCSFRADYGSGPFRCSDGRCPSGLVCNADRQCEATAVVEDAALVDAPPDAPPDVPDVVHALTCADPGELDDAAGTTVGRANEIAAMCGGFVMNGSDAVYRLVPAMAGAQYRIVVTGVKAYVVATCARFGESCAGNVAAAAGAPITFTAASTAGVFVVVDHESPATAADYVLTVTRL
jgi:hypothetical protein